MKTTISMTLDVVVHFNYHPAIPGARDCGRGLKLEPDEDASLEVLQASVNGTRIELTEKQIEEIQFDLWEAYRADLEAAAEARADARREERMLEGW